MTTSDRATTGQTPPKTLDDIRRELDAEYARSTPRLDDDHDLTVEPRSAPHREARSRGRVRAAVVGCIIGQVLLVGAYVAVTRHTGDVVSHSATPSALGPAAPSPANETRVLPAAVPAAAPEPRVDPEVQALRAQVASLAAKLERAESRVAGAESRVTGVESSVRRFGNRPAPAAVGTEPAPVRAPTSMAAKQAATAPLPSASTPVTATDAERTIPSEDVVTLPSPPLVGPPVDAIAASPPSEPRRSLEASGPPPAPSLMDKLRGDWRTIKQSFANAGDDFKTTMDNFAQKLRRE